MTPCRKLVEINRMSANDILECFLTGLFFLLYLLHLPVMVSALKKNGGFRNRKLAVYTVVSILPVIVSGACLFFGPDDLGGRSDLAEFHWVMLGYLVVSLVFCVGFLFIKLAELSLKTRIKVLFSTILAVVMSWIAFLGSIFATV